MKLDEAPEAYEAYDNREALKIVLSPVSGAARATPAGRHAPGRCSG